MDEQKLKQLLDGVWHSRRVDDVVPEIMALIARSTQRAVVAALEGLKKQPIRGQVPLEGIGTIKAGYYRDGFNEADLIWAKNIDQALAEVRREKAARYSDEPTEHPVPCSDCGSSHWVDWALKPDSLFNQICPGGNGYLCFPCFVKRSALRQPTGEDGR